MLRCHRVRVRTHVPTQRGRDPRRTGFLQQGSSAVAVRDHELVACEGEWDISRALEFATPRRRCAGALPRIADPRLPRGDIRRRDHGRSDLRARARGLPARREGGRRVRRGSRGTRLRPLPPVRRRPGRELVEAATAMFRPAPMRDDLEHEVHYGYRIAQAEGRRRARAAVRDDDVDEASDESFPASDPPSFGSAEPDGG